MTSPDFTLTDDERATLNLALYLARLDQERKAAAAFPSIRSSDLTDRAKRIRDLRNALKTRNLI